MLEKRKRALDRGEYVSGLLMDLSKVFDTINHDLLIAKLEAYGFSKQALKLMKSYLKNRKQKVQINIKVSSERDLIAGVLQGSIDGPLLFNLFINDLIFFIEQCTLRNYADDNKIYASSDFMIVEDWFLENYMILNPEKCCFMCISKNGSNSGLLNLGDLNLENCKEVEILGIMIDRNLNFKGHIKNIRRKSGQKLTLTKKLYFTNQ